MLGEDEKPEGTIRVYYADNTYKTVPLRLESTAGEVVEWLCQRRAACGAPSDVAGHELLIVTLGSGALRERQLSRDDRPLQIQQASGGASAFKFVLREVRARRAAADAGADADAGEREAMLDGDGSTMVPLVSDASGHLKTGTLERLLPDGKTWHACSIVLDEDSLWYSLPPGPEGGGVGGGMASISLRGCDRAREGDEKREFRLFAGGRVMSFRAKTPADQKTWLLLIARQAALVKERDMLFQADHFIANMEAQSSAQQSAALEALRTLPGVLAGPKQARQLFLDFVRSEHSACAAESRGGAGGGERFWPEGVPVDEVIAHLEQGSVRAPDEGSGNDVTSTASAAVW
eukprot:CAMPEP_0170234582 /NCGR_PEP_ID=MMETSP0116_2-20130129/17037_1 /TAXON_ID=400756 /ORGANISM="Durinskia baltica, Strain CSIRO CS-38" /LENGTH=347 /DNA_ID=CAMNT_0010485377 /DNA_START=93 /DNA_END=1133 /DNA_ORIENTATION=-